MKSMSRQGCLRGKKQRIRSRIGVNAICGRWRITRGGTRRQCKRMVRDLVLTSSRYTTRSSGNGTSSRLMRSSGLLDVLVTIQATQTRQVSPRDRCRRFHTSDMVSPASRPCRSSSVDAGLALCKQNAFVDYQDCRGH
jgi:hypothetical protein